MQRSTIAIVGAGRVGTVLAKRLAQAGFEITEIISGARSSSQKKARRLAREAGARVSIPGGALLKARVVWFCVPDSKIAKAAAVFRHRDWSQKIVFHSSGPLNSEALAVLRKKGAAVASVHPLMTFVPGTLPELRNVTFAAEGDVRALATARRIIRALGGETLPLGKTSKPMYHAFATMICPLLVSLLATAEKIGALSGIQKVDVRRRMMPIVRQTLSNYFRLGPSAAFTGPIARGDVLTIGQHLSALSGARDRKVYLALAREAVDNLPAKNRASTGALLDRVSMKQTGRSRRRIGRASRSSARRS